MNYLAILLISTTILISCGKENKKSKNNHYSNAASIPSTEGMQVVEGSYRAILRPINNQLSGFLPSGVAEIKIIGNKVQVKTLLDDDARVTHVQSIHMGTTCPTSEQDLNRDGLIDVKEAMRVTGEVFIPLDGDLDSAEEGAGVYPLGGNYTYVENTSLSKMATDAKDRTGFNLKLVGRVVLIHGVDGATDLPETVASLGHLTRQASIPIACGILQKEK